MSNFNPFQIFAMISAADTLSKALPALVKSLAGFSTNKALASAVAASPILAADVADISQKLRTVQQSAGHVGSDKNFLSKVSEAQRLVGHVKDLIAAFNKDTTDPAVLQEVAASTALQSWLAEVMGEWLAIQGALKAFSL